MRRALLNIVIRNQDDHTKNIAFLMNRGGQWRLSPAFDVTYAYNPTGDWTSEHQMSLGGKTDNFDINDLLQFGKFADLKTTETKGILADIAGAVDKWDQFVGEAEVSEEMARRARAGFRSF